MAEAPVLLDGLLVLTLVLCAAAALLSRDLFRAVVMYIAFGLVMSLAWVRLRAPDLALAEAAIGAGLSGALMLDAVGQLRRGGGEGGRHPTPFIAALCVGFAVLLVSTLLTSLTPSPRLGASLSAAMPASGVSHEVTAVLLNFRGYDTFLEICVLAVAAFSCLELLSGQGRPPPMRTLSNPLLNIFVAWLSPLMLMVAFYLYWAGSKEPGGAFQAGALLAAGGVLLRLSGMQLTWLLGPPLRFGLSAGIGAFLIAGLAGPLLFGLPLFSYPPRHAGWILLTVEALLTLSIGVTLLCLFVATPPYRRRDRER